ncbi:MAG: DNA-protecting protein DprA [Clostridiales bacterium]|nr:DNA-protecting protein DprA [Clostridiales bacterium]
MTESEALAVLVSAQSIGYGQREQALEHAGSALSLLADPYAQEKILGAEGAAELRDALKNSERMLEQLRHDGVSLIARGSAQYPERLAQTAKPPHLLFCKGAADLNDPTSISIVGTRRADNYGLRHTRRIAKELAEKGVCVVSGLALGVDAAAHWGALDAKGRTVAVLGSALDKLYPAENRALMEQILQSGGSVVSEYPPGAGPTRYSFVQRNRIVAGMALGVLVTQAPHKSGALSTVNYALEEGREVFALPGDIDRFGSQLPNKLIAEGAHPVATAQDILSLMVTEPRRNAGPKKKEAPQQIALRPAAPARPLDAAEQKVYDQLLAGDLDFDALSSQTGIGGDELGSLLMMLELDGIVVSLPGLVYRLI